MSACITNLRRDRVVVPDLLDLEDPNALLLLAADSGKIEQLEQALEQGASLGAVDSAGRNALVLATMNGYGPMVRHLLRLDCSPTISDANGVRLLAHFAREGWEDLVELTLAAGVPVDGTVNPHVPATAETPFILAARGGHAGVLRILHAAGANVHATTDTKTNAMHGSHASVIGLLVEMGCDINAKSVRGATPLINAVTLGNFHSAELLVGHGADLNAVTTEGESAIERAVIMGRPECFALLLDAGADYDRSRLEGLWEQHTDIQAVFNSWQARQAIVRAHKHRSLPTT